MRLLNEKDSIVRRTEYFNVLEQLREVEDDILHLQRELGSASNIERKFLFLMVSLLSKHLPWLKN